MNAQGAQPHVLALARLASLRVLHAVVLESAAVNDNLAPNDFQGSALARKVVHASHGLSGVGLRNVVPEGALTEEHIKPRHYDEGVPQVVESATREGHGSSEVVLVHGVLIVRLPVDLVAQLGVPAIENHVRHLQLPVAGVLAHRAGRVLLEVQSCHLARHCGAL